MKFKCGLLLKGALWGFVSGFVATLLVALVNRVWHDEGLFFISLIILAPAQDILHLFGSELPLNGGWLVTMFVFAVNSLLLAIAGALVGLAFEVSAKG